MTLTSLNRAIAEHDWEIAVMPGTENDTDLIYVSKLTKAKRLPAHWTTT